jgi:GNAT superfamily N-acetyltransferase
MDGLLIREITLADAEAASWLSAELGYSTPPGVISQRIEAIAKLTDHAVYVCCLAEEVVGWIDVGVVRHLQAEPRAEIGGLVVSSRLRSGGIGRRLLARAEEWALQQGLKSVIVRSRIAREAAQRFYLREGYEQIKTQAVFTKMLG